MSEEHLTQEEYLKLKAELKRLIASGDHAAIRASCRRAIAVFDRKGYPDDWSLWVAASEDAAFAMRPGRPLTGLLKN